MLQASEPLYFKGKTVEYRMPEAYKYPILSAMRAVVNVEKTAQWTVDPVRLLQETGPQLTSVVGNTVRSYQNPNKVGKDVGTWSSCYLVVESALRSTMVQELQAQLAALKRTQANL